jgi:hypothetical protein
MIACALKNAGIPGVEPDPRFTDGNNGVIVILDLRHLLAPSSSQVG